MDLDIGYCFSKNGQIIYKDLGDGPALIDPYRRTLVKMNPTALYIWELLDGGRSVAAIIEILKAEFEIDPKIIKKDVINFLKELNKREIIK